MNDFMKSGVEPSTNSVASAHRDHCINEPEHEVSSRRDMKAEEREDQHVGRVVDTEADQHVDPRFDERFKPGLIHNCLVKVSLSEARVVH